VLPRLVLGCGIRHQWLSEGLPSEDSQRCSNPCEYRPEICSDVLLSGAGLVPVNNVDELPGILIELKLKLALFVDH
jgi:hypothetical protein